MAIQERPQYNMDLGRTRERFQVAWFDVRAEVPHDDALAKGAARFQRLEGCHFAGGAFWFDDTSGGEARVGQVFRLIPSGDPSGGGEDTLELFLEGGHCRAAAPLVAEGLIRTARARREAGHVAQRGGGVRPLDRQLG